VFIAFNSTAKRFGPSRFVTVHLSSPRSCALWQP